MFYSIIILSILFIIVILWHYGKKPYKHLDISQNELEKYLKILLFRGYENGVMYIEVSNNIKLKFSKYMYEKNLMGIQYSFPLEKWSKTYYDLLKKVLYDNNIKFKIDKNEDDDFFELLIVDLKQDIKWAQNVATVILQDVFALKNSDKVNLYFENVSARNENGDGHK